jgi:hypothetical protein
MEKEPYKFNVDAKDWGDTTQVQFRITVMRRDGKPAYGRALLVLSFEGKSVQCPVAQVPADSVVAYEFLVSRSFVESGEFTFRASRSPGMRLPQDDDIAYLTLLARHYPTSKV